MRVAPLIAIGAIVLACFFDNFSQLPIMAPYARALGASPAVVGLVVAIYSVTNLLGNLAGGYLFDQVDRRRLLVAGLVLAGMAVLLYVAARTPTHLLLIRALHGGAVAVLTPAAFAMLGDYFPRGRRKGPMAASGAIIAMAAIVAPVTSGVIKDRWGFAGVFLFVGALLLSTGAASWLLLGASRPAPGERRHTPRVFLMLLRRPGLLTAYLAAVVLTFGLGTLVTYLPLHMSDFGYGGAQTGLALSAFALVAMLAMVSPLARTAGDRTRLLPAAAGLFLVGCALLLLPIGTGLPATWAFMGLYGLGFGLIFPSANARVADLTDQGERGSAFGLFYAFWSVGVILGASAAGFMVERGTLLSPFHLAAALAFPSAIAVLLTRQALAPAGVDRQEGALPSESG